MNNIHIFGTQTDQPPSMRNVRGHPLAAVLWLDLCGQCAGLGWRFSEGTPPDWQGVTLDIVLPPALVGKDLGPWLESAKVQRALMDVCDGWQRQGGPYLSGTLTDAARATWAELERALCALA